MIVATCGSVFDVCAIICFFGRAALPPISADFSSAEDGFHCRFLTNSIHSGTLYLKPLANCYIASAFDLVDCQSTSSAWWEGWESNPLTQRERFYRPPRLSDFAALPYGTPQGFEPIPLVLETNVLPIKLSVYVVVLLTLRRTPLVKTGVRLCKDISDRPHQITNFSILV